jgi:hypothetical protein
VGTGQKLGPSSGRFGTMVNRMMKAGNSLFICCAILAAINFSCGIFSPRGSETPEPKPTGILDPLNFKKIMTGTGEQFTKPQYEDYFADGEIYEDINSGPSSKDQLKSRLNYIQQQYPKIAVQWTANPGGIWKNNSSDTMVLSGLKYVIYYSGIFGNAPDDSGSSNFTLAKNLEWRIIFWKDMPASSQKSFFSP